MKLKAKRIAITLGDPCGIGPEVVAQALRQVPKSTLKNLVVIGDIFSFKRYYGQDLQFDFINLSSNKTARFIPGRPNAISARASLDYLNSAIELLKQKKVNALVTAPVAKESIAKLGIDFPGHTEYLAQAFQVKRFGMMFVAKDLKMILVTRHLPINKVSRTISVSNIAEAISLMNETLQTFFEKSNPVIAVCGLNPHAGEGGYIGKEEITRIIPAIKNIQRRGISVAGPLAADTLFCPTVRKKYDGIVAMYHDQGLAPVKALYLNQLVNLTVGLPFVRTSPAHGTAFDIAGKNKADPSSMLEAIRLAFDLIK